jgi:hypothetical protein
MAHVNGPRWQQHCGKRNHPAQRRGDEPEKGDKVKAVIKSTEVMLLKD